MGAQLRPVLVPVEGGTPGTQEGRDTPDVKVGLLFLTPTSSPAGRERDEEGVGVNHPQKIRQVGT